MVASSLNFFGAAISLLSSNNNVITPLYYTAMATSFLYMSSNAVKIYQIRQSNVEAEMERRAATLQEVTVQTR